METQQLPGDRDSAEPPVDDEVATAPSRSSGVSGADDSGSADAAASGSAAAAEEAGDAGGRALRWKELALLLAVCVLGIVLLNRFVAQPFTIPSGSMENTLAVGDRVLVNKLSYDFGGAPQRGDVVVFDGRGSFIDTETQDTRDASGDDFVKRVIGVAGDTVKCCDAHGRITVDGVPLDEGSYLYPGAKPSAFPFVVVVPAGKLFVLGDNRAVSADSRDHFGDPGGGFVPVDRVIGRAEWVILPFGHSRSLDRPEVFAELDRAIAAAATGGGARGHQG
ncbi:signal peptidase I [Streptacidiphilus rugosus]|uniref:signal peptidase I n=1 Tax=Streptacidiphilus rugosus TaxID=405783 RepID=UPI000561C8B9|nr:signal peptidase I [Streptacidiphilus rugosus]